MIRATIVKHPAAPQAPWADPVIPILQNAPVAEDIKADIWDAYHDSRSDAELAQKLQPLAISDSIKHELYLAKQKSMPPADPIATALQIMKSIPVATLDWLEKNKNTLKAFVDAAIHDKE